VTNTGTRPGATVVQVYALPPAKRGLELPARKLVGFRRTKVLAPGESQRLTIKIPLATTLRMWNAALRRQVVYRGDWRLRVSRSAVDSVRTFKVRVHGRIPRTIRTVTLAPVQLTLRPGQTIDLRGRNPWLQGLAPTGLDDAGDSIITAVNADDSFADPKDLRPVFSSDRPAVAAVDAAGKVTAVAAGVTTIRVNLGAASASTPIVVR